MKAALRPVKPVRSNRNYVPRSEDEMKRIEEIVKKSHGLFDGTSGPVEVVNVQFGLGLKSCRRGGGSGGGPDEAWILPYLRYAVGGVLFFLILHGRPSVDGHVGGVEPISAAAETPALPASVGQVEAAISGKQPADPGHG